MDKGKKIKVLFRHRSMEMGGVEKVLLSLLKNLDRRRFELSVLVNLHQGELRNEIPDDIPHHFLAKGKEDFSENKFIHLLQKSVRGIRLLAFRKLPRLLKLVYKNDADIEVATGYTTFSDVLNSPNRNSRKIGWFHSDISAPTLQPAVPLILRQIPRFDFFIFGSRQARDILLEKYPQIRLPPNKVILNAIPIEELREKASAERITFQKPTFIAVGRLDPRKGFHKLAEAQAALLKEGYDCDVIIIGDGPERARLEKQISDLGIQNNFWITGSKMNPYPWVQNADFFIMPSESEGWPLIIAEALLLRKPIIATAVGGIPEMIESGKNGLLTTYDASEIKSAMKQFLTDPGLIRDISKNLENSEAQFDNGKIFRSVEEVFENTYQQ